MLRGILTIAATAAVTMVTGSAKPEHATQPSCVSNPDTANNGRLHFEQLVTKADSVTLAKLGLPYRPVEGVAVVADETICGLAVTAFNSLYQSDSANFIARALVMRVGANRYVVWGVRPRSGSGRDLYFVFDQNFQFVKLIA